MKTASTLLALPWLLAATQDPPVPATPPARTDLKPAVWQGYLFRDGDRLFLGRNVVAMGVMAMPPHAFAEALAKKLSPLASAAKTDWTFLNYQLEREDVALATIPRVLVRVRGKIEVEGGEDEMPFGRGGPRTMHEGKLESVEFLPEAWLGHWAAFFRDTRSPFRIARDVASDAERQAFAPKALATLRAMRAVPGPGDAERDKVAAIDRHASIVERFRRDTEWSIQRWLVTFAKEHALDLEGLDTLGPLPPSSVEIQRWFLAAENKKDFLAKVEGEWQSIDDLALVHYVSTARSTTYTTTELADVKTWSDEEFARHQATTRSTLGDRR